MTAARIIGYELAAVFAFVARENLIHGIHGRLANAVFAGLTALFALVASRPLAKWM